MRTEVATSWSRDLIGSDRDAADLALRVRAGTSLLVAGPRGSGRSYMLRTIAERLQELGSEVFVVRPASALASVPFGALTAGNSPALRTLTEGSSAAFDGVVVLDDVDELDPDSARVIARAVATRRLTAVVGLRTARPRSQHHPDGADEVRRTFLDLWMDGLIRRIDLPELSDDDARRMIELFSDADLLDVPTRAGLVWRADGSRTLLRQLVLEALRAVRAGRDPLRAVRSVARDSRLAIALDRHVAGFLRQDLECLAGIRRLAHLELAVATRLFDPDSVEALLGSGLLHADGSPERRLTANDLFASGAHRELGDDAVDGVIERAGTRMLAAAGQWWSSTIAVAVAERWHRLGHDASGESAYAPDLRARIALDAARDANDRGDTAHAAAHAARGLAAVEDPALRVEVALAHHGDLEAVDDDVTDESARRRLARLQALRAAAGMPTSAHSAQISLEQAEADAQVERLLSEATRAGNRLDTAKACELLDLALSLPDVSPLGRLRALVAAGTAQGVRGQWEVARAHYRDARRLLDAQPHPRGISTRERLRALMFILIGHQISGADGTAAHLRLERELDTAAREGNASELTVAGSAAAIAFAGSGRPEQSHRELVSALRRGRPALSDPETAMMELSVAEELALAGRPDHARSLIAHVDDDGPLLVRRSRLYVQTTVLVAEGRIAQACATARAAADLSAGSTAAALRIRDLFRLVSLDIAEADEIDELVQLAATTDLPLAADAVRRASARCAAEDGLPVDELRLHALWSTTPAEIAAQSDTPTAAPPPAPREELTSREREVALLANDGLTNRQIAARLFLSIRTVESHVYQARLKLGAASRRDLARMVAEMVSPREPSPPPRSS
ncbi:regulatory protein, luxR family [Microbacterium sp. ru370.1]|uniref:helix-turn-helix transcriptional regulator n=1 Tax=unclassified Microbacterium TaxID=2609290 RepID=UPI000889C04E|nr:MULTISPECIES: LuxR family transcriptional regulator [unclassified Microbacterium]SDO58421.1 regulatory protein, luxR family [Microbacterium sp. ru370.1]SIT85768.1 regulatory protein, luxR family [Microbacterium sp. RU1D]